MLGACVTNGAPPTATETAGAQVCPLGWTQGLSAEAQGSKIVVQGSCGTTANFALEFSPTPPSGGTAPLSRFCINADCFVHPEFRCGWGYDQSGQGYLDPNAVETGTLTVSGSNGSLRVDGDGSCMETNGPPMASVEFSMPLVVQ